VRLNNVEIASIVREESERGDEWTVGWEARVGERLSRALSRAWDQLPDAVRSVLPFNTFVNWLHALQGAKIVTGGLGRQYVEDGHARRLAEVEARRRRTVLARTERGKARAQSYRKPYELESKLVETLLEADAAVAEGEAPPASALKDLHLPPEIDREGWGAGSPKSGPLSLDEPVADDADVCHADAVAARGSTPAEAAEWAEVGAAYAVADVRACRDVRRIVLTVAGLRAVRLAAARIARRSRRRSGRRWAARFLPALLREDMSLGELSARSGLAKSTLSEARSDVLARVRRDPRVTALAS